MGNPSSGCTVQVPMSLSIRRHRQSLSLQLEQLQGQLGSSIAEPCETKKSASALCSPKQLVSEENSKPNCVVASFLSNNICKPSVARRKPSSSLCGNEEYLNRLNGGASSDRKPSSFNPFRGHGRVGSGSTVTPSKSLDSPRDRERGGSLSFRKDNNNNNNNKSLDPYSPRENHNNNNNDNNNNSKGGSLSFRKDKFAAAKIAASLFHSPTKIERSMSMSIVTACKGIPDQVVSLRQKFQLSSSSDGSQTFISALRGGKGSSALHTSAEVDIEESARPLISNASSLQHECVSDKKNSTDGADEELLSTVALHDSQSLIFTGDIIASEELKSDHSDYGFVDNAPADRSFVAPKSSALPSGTSEKYGASSLEIAEGNNLQPCAKNAEIPEAELSFSPAIGPSSIGSQSARIETDSSEESNVGESKIYAAEDIDIHSLLFTTEKVTEEELTEAAVLSSFTSEDYLRHGPLFFSSEDSQKNLLDRHTGSSTVSSDERNNETGGLIKTMSEACTLTKCMSFEPVARDKSKADLAQDCRKSKIRKRRRSVSASGIGAMLLKVVRVTDSGPMLTRRLPKVGPEVVISGADALRAREYVLQKTAQISMGRAAHESSSIPISPASAAVLRCEPNDAVKSTDSAEGVCVELEQHSKDGFEGVDSTGCEGESICESTTRLQRNQQTTTSEMGPGRQLSDPASQNSTESACTREGISMSSTPTAVGEAESCCFYESKPERVNLNLQRAAPDGKLDSTQMNLSQNIVNTSAIPAASAAGPAANNADDRRGGKPRKKSNSRGRNSYDSDSLTEGPRCSVRSNSGLGRSSHKQASLVDATSVAISRERSRSFISRLQAPSGISSVDVFHVAPSSISILANPSFSSSHQDRLWEEQAEAYSSGGRGTPGREDVDETTVAATATTSAANVFLHSPSPPPGAPASLDDHQVGQQVPSASASLRRGLTNGSSTMAINGPSSINGEKGGKHKRRAGHGKKSGRPEHTPLRSLMANDIPVHNNRKCATTRSRASAAAAAEPRGRLFIQQILSRIRGSCSSSTKSAGPKSPDAASKRRILWSSCICFSVE